LFIGCSLGENVASAAVYLNSSIFWYVMQHRSVKNQCFGTIYQAHLHGSSVPKHQTTLCNIPEGGRIHQSNEAYVNIEELPFHIKITEKVSIF
jgi:hypothetical protein